MGDRNGFATASPSDDSCVMLRIFVIDRALVDRTAATFAALENRSLVATAQSQALDDPQSDP
jgi:hypothetical protein